MTNAQHRFLTYQTSWLLALAVFGLAASPAVGQGLTYVDADEAFAMNLEPADGSPVFDEILSSSSGTDDKWGFRNLGASNSVYESGVGLEDAKLLRQTVSGLAPGNYDFYTVYWTDDDENWSIRTGVNSGSLTYYDFSGLPSGGGTVPGGTPGITAAAAYWTTPPGSNPSGKIYTADGTNLPSEVNDRVLLLGKAGSVTVDGTGVAQVFVDDLPTESFGAGAGRRTWFDGVAYVAAGTPIALSTTIDRATGALSITNPTASNFQVKSVSVTSSAGSLNATAFTPVSGWMVTAPANPATTPFATQLAQQEPSPGAGATIPSGGALSMGNVWQKTPFEDVRITLTLADDAVAIVLPRYTGSAIAPGDFNGDGSINLADFQRLMTNLHTSTSGVVLADAFTRGDINTDGLVNFSDFAAFRATYNALGVGSFEALMAQVPEPGSFALLAIAGAFVTGLARRGARRAVACGVGVTVTVALAGGAHAQLLAVDVDDRETAAAGTEAGNTLAGFNSFTLNGTTTAQTAATTRTIAGYNVTLAPFDDLLDENNVTAGVQSGVGAIDDRDRATPVNSGALTNAQIYDDVVFAGASAGPTGGMDLTVSGGALVPNKAYVVSIYAFDSGGNGLRTANWFDVTNPASPVLTTSFAGTVLPTSNDQYKFTGIAQTDSTGALLLQGRNTSGYVAAGGVQPGVHINGFEIREFTGLTLEVNTATGAARFLNEQAASVPLSYYEIRSTAGALNKDGWVSFDDTEGGDPVGAGWDEAGGSSANILSEGNLTGMRTLSAGASASLGSAFTAGASADLRFFYSAPGDVSLHAGFVKYVTGGGSDADYDNDSDVDGQDFLLWQRQLGSTVANGTGADGSGNGVVDAADLSLWRTQFGTAATAAAAAIPEPSSLCLFLLMALAARRYERVS